MQQYRVLSYLRAAETKDSRRVQEAAREGSRRAGSDQYTALGGDLACDSRVDLGWWVAHGDLVWVAGGQGYEG